MAAVAGADVFQFLRFHDDAVKRFVGIHGKFRFDAGVVVPAVKVHPAGVQPDWSATGNSAQFSADTPGEYHILATNNGATAEFVLNVTAPAATPTPTSTPSGG